ncbi:very short patch repair endonuclease [Sinorhizobium alkalisoli]|uniref:very short patch repair endonuclease n=1 Tax=Sinorhizobium alkalisoli TaxID=1752398 RepID=UPI001FE84698|nr:very short patch repair endonuclease [Sinorhizobium alkalisoli]
MARIASKNTKPEMIVRRMVHAMGYRYRLHRRDLPGKPDLVFPSRRAVIFVHGCFWHHHPDPACKDAVLPKSRTDYWSPKLARNEERDKQHVEALAAEGWHVLIIWECEVSAADLSDRIRRFLEHTAVPRPGGVY